MSNSNNDNFHTDVSSSTALPTPVKLYDSSTDQELVRKVKPSQTIGGQSISRAVRPLTCRKPGELQLREYNSRDVGNMCVIRDDYQDRRPLPHSQSYQKINPSSHAAAATTSMMDERDRNRQSGTKRKRGERKRNVLSKPKTDEKDEKMSSAGFYTKSSESQHAMKKRLIERTNEMNNPSRAMRVTHVNYSVPSRMNTRTPRYRVNAPSPMDCQRMIQSQQELQDFRRRVEEMDELHFRNVMRGTNREEEDIDEDEDDDESDGYDSDDVE